MKTDLNIYTSNHIFNDLARLLEITEQVLTKRGITE